MLQVYTGLDVITAKATREERAIAPHHLIDVVDPLKAFTVVDFRNRAVNIVSLIILDLIKHVVNKHNYLEVVNLILELLVFYENTFYLLNILLYIYILSLTFDKQPYIFLIEKNKLKILFRIMFVFLCS